MTSKIFVFLITAALASNVVKIFVDINDDSNNDAHDSDGVKNDVAKNYAFVDDAENDANDVAKMVDATNDDDRFDNNADDVAETDVSEDDEKDDPIDSEDQQHVAGTWKELAKEVYREDSNNIFKASSNYLNLVLLLFDRHLGNGWKCYT